MKVGFFSTGLLTWLDDRRVQVAHCDFSAMKKWPFDFHIKIYYLFKTKTFKKYFKCQIKCGYVFQKHCYSLHDLSKNVQQIYLIFQKISWLIFQNSSSYSILFSSWIKGKCWRSLMSLQLGQFKIKYVMGLRFW